MAFNISSPGVIIFLLMSSVYSVTLSVPQHESRVFIAKSWGVPVKLTCDDRSTRRIDISGISLFKFKHTFEADDYFPGIKAQSQRECQLSFHSANKTVPAECELRFQGKVLPFDVMVVAVYRCLAPALLPNETIHTGTSETGDVELGCGFGNIIDVLDVTINKSKLGEEDNEIAKQRCSMEMFQQQLPAQEEKSNRKKPVVCTVLREGRLGKLMVKYLCLPAPVTGSGQIVDDNTNVASQQKNMNFHHSQHHYKNGLLRLSRSQT